MKTIKLIKHNTNIQFLKFKKAALIHSNSETSANGGIIGWVKEDNLNQYFVFQDLHFRWS